MNLRRLDNALIFVGLLMVGGSLAWWQKFYSEVAAALGTKFDPPVQCLYSTAGICGEVADLAAMVGANPYRPGFFWIGSVALVVGGILQCSAQPRRSDASPVRSSGEKLVVPGPDGVSSEEWERFKAVAFPKDKP